MELKAEAVKGRQPVALKQVPEICSMSVLIIINVHHLTLKSTIQHRRDSLNSVTCNCNITNWQYSLKCHLNNRDLIQNQFRVPYFIFNTTILWDKSKGESHAVQWKYYYIIMNTKYILTYTRFLWQKSVFVKRQQFLPVIYRLICT